MLFSVSPDARKKLKNLYAARRTCVKAGILLVTFYSPFFIPSIIHDTLKIVKKLTVGHALIHHPTKYILIHYTFF